VTPKRLFQLLTVLLGMGLLLDLVSRLGAEMLWFQEVNYFSVFLLKFQVRLILLGIVTGVTAVYLLGNLALAERLKHAHRPNEGSQGEEINGRQPVVLLPYRAKLQRSPPVPLQSTTGDRDTFDVIQVQSWDACAKTAYNKSLQRRNKDAWWDAKVACRR